MGQGAYFIGGAIDDAVPQDERPPCGGHKAQRHAIRQAPFAGPVYLRDDGKRRQESLPRTGAAKSAGAEKGTGTALPREMPPYQFLGSIDGFQSPEYSAPPAPPPQTTPPPL